jgi:hypothetical protein
MREEFRSDNKDIVTPRYTGVSEYEMGECIVFRFYYVVGMMTYAVDILRKDTDEVVRLTGAEFEAMFMSGRTFRSLASTRDL